MALQRYYTVAVRDSETAPWGVHFGSYDREEARQEMVDIRGHDYKAGNVKVISSHDTQPSINAAINRL